MTIPITSCCCSGSTPPGTCEDICDCASTYNLVTWSMTFAGVKQDRIVNQCESPCDQYDGPVHKIEHSLSIMGTQLGTAILQKYTEPGGGCCYQADGEVRLTVGWDYVGHYYCCPPIGDPCTYLTGLDDTVDVPYCLTAVCARHPITGEIGLKWVLIICSFTIGQAWVLSAPDPLCTGYDNCDEPPLSQVWVQVGPARFTWWTKLKCPVDLIQPVDYPYLSLCWPSESSCGPPIPGQDPLGLGTSCAWEQELLIANAGPFALALRTGGTDPGLCATSLGLSGCNGFVYPCTCVGNGKDLLLGACQGQVDYSSPCCEVTMSAAILYPTFT